MTFTYDPTAPTERDLLRMLLRDTTAPGHWQDEELDTLLAKSQSFTQAWRYAVAAEAARLATAAARSLTIITQNADFASRALEAISAANPDQTPPAPSTASPATPDPY